MIPYISIIKQYERLAVFTLGKYSGLRNPGIQLLVWPFHKTTKIDLREDVFDIPSQTVITLDNAPISVDFLVYLRVMETEAHKSVLEVVRYQSAVVGIATLRAEGFSLALDRVNQVAQNVDSNTLSLQYFDTLKEMGAGDSTKFVFPMEFTKLLEPFLNKTDK